MLGEKMSSMLYVFTIVSINVPVLIWSFEFDPYWFVV